MAAGAEVVDSYGRATLYTSLFFELGSQQPLHRDTPYFYSGGDGGYMGVWVALDNVDENNGALMVVEGSHKLPEPDLIALREQFHPSGNVPASSPELFDAYNLLLADAANMKGLPIKSCCVQRGDMIIWNPATLHGGLSHIDKSRTRRSFVMHITPKNMPMQHMDYFFDRSKIIKPIEKNYLPIGSDRLISAGDQIDFRHVKSFSCKDLGVF
jgi:ectoine hydroxylase-related dioxygenase (phytanoyl-CoA dioxygenase family)